MNILWEAPGPLAENIVDSIREALIILDETGHVVLANRSFYRQFQVSPAETKTRLLYELGNGQWNIPALRQLLEKLVPGNETMEDFEVRHQFEQIGEKIMLLNARRIEWLSTEDRRPKTEDRRPKTCPDPTGN